MPITQQPLEPGQGAYEAFVSETYRKIRRHTWDRLAERRKAEWIRIERRILEAAIEGEIPFEPAIEETTK